MQYTNAHTTHNATQLKQFATALDNFVNNNAVNINVQGCCTEEEFLQAVAAHNVTVTQTELCAMPVFVYMHNNNFVAWWDEELQYGYIAA